MVFPAIIVISIAMYFLVAAFVPRIRLPRVGMVTCLGMSVFIGCFSLPMIWNHTPREWMERGLTAGLALAGLGAVVDWLREPNIRKRK